MATYGSDPTFSDWYLSESNTQTQVAFLGTMPQDGYITAVDFYAGGLGGSVPGVGCVWNGSGTLLYTGGGVTIPSGSEGVGTQSWNADSGGTPVFVAGGTPIYIGWWRKPSDSVVWSTASYGTEYVQNYTGASPGSLSPSSQEYAIGAYITYTPSDAPSVNTDAATSVTATTATLNGDLNPNGLDTQGYFEWGTTVSYGNTTANQDQGSGTSDVDFSQAITGLSANTLYHFRACGTNAIGTSYGADQTFEQIIISASGSGAISFSGLATVPVPVVTVSAPTGTNADANPNVLFSATFPTGTYQASYRVIVYSSAQQGGGGFTPGTSPSTWDSGTISGSGTSAAPVGIPNFGTFYAYALVTSTLGVPSLWAYSEWVQAVGIVAVQVGFPASASGTSFTLNDPVKGQLNNTTYTLGGTQFVDVTAYCSGTIAVSRGRSRETDQYQTGTASFTLRNESRIFDPTNTASPYYPGIVPRAPVNIYVGGLQVFAGYIDDYNVDYEKPDICTVAVTATDALALLANAYINNWSASQELTGQRLLDILSQNFPSFPAPLAIAAGQTTVQSNIFGANTGGGGQGDVMLDDMQNIAASEWGFLFVDRLGNLTFLDRYAIIRQIGAGTNYATFSDLTADLEAGAFPYSDIGLISATLLLYNQTQVTRNSNANISDDQPITQIANDSASQNLYLLRALTLPTVENYTDADAGNLGQWVLSLYSEPEVRFDTLQVVDLESLSLAQLQTLAALDIPDLCTVKRTPPGTGSPTTITLSSYIDQISWHFDVSASTAKMGLSFGSAENIGFFQLNSAEYGQLNVGQLAY